MKLQTVTYSIKLQVKLASGVRKLGIGNTIH